MADDDLMDILEESDAESELTESGDGDEEQGEASEEEEEENQHPLHVQPGEFLPSSVQDLVDGGSLGGGLESGGWSNTMLLKQEIFDQTDAGWLGQHHAKGGLGHVQIKEEEPGRRRSRGN